MIRAARPPEDAEVPSAGCRICRMATSSVTRPLSLTRRGVARRILRRQLADLGRPQEERQVEQAPGRGNYVCRGPIVDPSGLRAPRERELEVVRVAAELVRELP